MNSNLLYENRDWMNEEQYFDANSIIQDLSLHILFRMASRQVFRENGEVKTISDSDRYIEETMRKVAIVPLKTAEEIYYRQEILKDCRKEEQFTRALYGKVSDILQKWDALGRRESNRGGKQNTIAGLLTDVHVLNLFVSGLSDIKQILIQHKDALNSKGWQNFVTRFLEAYSDETEANYKEILRNISFFVENNQEENRGKMTVIKPRIVLECGISEGFKISDIKLQSVEGYEKKYRDPNSTISKVQSFLNARTPDSISISQESPISDQTAAIEYEVVKYIVTCSTPLLEQFSTFFDQLHLQIAFYVGAINILEHMARFELESCYPVVGAQDELCFDDLKEFVMCMEQRVRAVGNTCDIKDKMLLIVTGANQGGKSTFLRSIGIAQIMMQCGLPVTAKSFRSGIYPSYFTHFTRREDSEMNSGRLDEELGRMNQIIEHLGERSLLLLNESFATTTEKEGSVIAYDIIKALCEAGVKILTVTHLLSFAQKVYAECEEADAKGEVNTATFLSAERMDDGRRTFKMIQHAPELTSFGLDLYEELIHNKQEITS